MATSFEQSAFPGIAKQTLTATLTTTSPAAIPVPAIPNYGRYLAIVTGWFGNNGDRAYAWYLVDYYKASTSNAVLSSQQLGTTVTTPGQTISAMTLSNPSSSGVLTVTITSSRGSSAGKATVELYELSGFMDQFAV